MEKEPRIEYVIYQCPHCGGKMSFKREPKNRRVHVVCAKCGKELEIYIK